MPCRLTLALQALNISIKLMWKSMRSSLLGCGLVIAVLAVLSGGVAFANTAKSPNFEAVEVEFGVGAALETCSGEYCAQATIGSMSGESSSENFTASFDTLDEDDDEPLLALIVEPGESNLGRLDIDRTATRTMKLHVRSHKAGGYIVQVIGAPPRYESYTLATPLEPVASLAGVEQFGINLVANDDPQVGQEPESTGEVIDDDILKDVIAEKYGMKNKFSYINGDVVAQTSSESSQIRYTVSMIVNVAGTTPAGHYSGDFSAIVTPVF